MEKLRIFCCSSLLKIMSFSFILEQDIDIRRFAGPVPNATAKGDIESMAMYAGQGVGLIKEILPAGEVVRRLVEGAQHQIQTHFSSYVHKV